jgi:osmotically-inducible protein OsmY
VLKGSVPTAAAKQKAVQLARDTIGVSNVIDELNVPAR